MLFMVIERFRDDEMLPAYRRLRESGRSLPEGLEYVDSWVESNFSRRFQLMRCDDLRLIQAWILEWRSSGVTFESSPSSPARRRGRSSSPISNHRSSRPEERLAAGRSGLITSHFACIHGLRGDARAYFREEIEADVSFAL
jgi:hypothetical protein